MNSTIAIHPPSSGNVKWSTGLTFVIGGVLAFNGFAEMFAVFGKSQLLNMPDPLLGVPFRYVSLFVAIFELLVALLCLLTNKRTLSLGLAVWLAVNFLVYRIGLWSLGWHHPFSWLQGLMNSLNLSPLRADVISLTTVFMLLFCGSAILWFEYQKIQTEQSSKMSCSSCGGHIKFVMQNLGRQIPCPHCQVTITLRRPDNLKMSCYFCHGHIEFPSHAIGEKMPCPHCKMDITLKEPA